jgi:cell division protein ZipA
MSDLRVILLLIGITIIAGVYAWTRYHQGPRPRPGRRRQAPADSAADELDSAEIEQELAHMERLLAGHDEEDAGGAPPVAERSASQGAATASVAAEQLVVVSVMAEPDAAFTGEALQKAFHHNKLKFGAQGIYHRMAFLNNREQPVFGVANLVKPGSFPEHDLERFSTPGLTLFLQLPGPLDALEAFDDFVKTAERLAVELGGELRDEKHQLLTHQGLMVVRDGIAKNRYPVMPGPA